MFDTGFAMLFRAVERIRVQLMDADDGLKKYLGEELLCLRRLGEQYIDHWMTLEDQISDLLETHQLTVHSPATVPGISLHIQHGDSSVHTDGMANKHPLVLPSRTSAEVSFPTTGEEDGAELVSYGWHHSDHVAVSFRKGLAYYDLFMFSDAARSLEEVANEMDTPVARLYLAASYAAQDLYQDAVKQLSNVRNATSDPLFLCAANEIEAQMFITQGNFAAAVVALRQITDCIAKYPDAWFNLSICYTSLEHYDMAEEASLKALRLNPTDVEAAVLLGTIRLRMGKVTEAVRTCQTALTRHPDHPELLKLSAHIAKQRGDYESSIQICSKLVQRSSDQEDIWSLLSWLYVKTGRLQQARLTLKKQLTLHPEQSTALLRLGLVSLLENDMSAAERVLLKCLAHCANRSLIWIGLGVVSMSKGHESQAHTRFLRATKDTRKEVKRLALYMYGKALLQAGRHSEAEKYLKAASALGDPNPAIVLALAEAARQLGRTVEAEKLFEKAQQATLHHPASNSPTQSGHFC